MNSLFSNPSNPSASSLTSARLNLTYTIQSSATRKETLCGVEYEIFGIISNYGDTVVHPGNAPGPCLIPKSALISLAELRNGRFVVVNHPSYFGVDVPSTFNKTVIESHQIGFWFNNYYDAVRNCIRGEIWIDPIRAVQVTNGQEILDRLRLGQKVEVSESNVCFSDPTPGQLNKQSYNEILQIMVPEHIAVLPNGIFGACSNKGGCGAAINMSSSKEGEQPMTITEKAKWIFRGLQGLGERNKTANQVLVTDIWSLLETAIAAIEPAFWGVRNFDPDKGLVFYATRIIMGDRYDGKTETKVLMRTYSIANGVVTLGDGPVEVIATETYEPVATINQIGADDTEVPVTINDDGSVTINPETPCSCQTQKEITMAEAQKPNETPVVTPTDVEPNAPATPASGENVGTTVGTTTSTLSTTNQAAPAVPANDWWNSVPPEVRTVLQGLAAQETAKQEALVKVAVNQGLPESAARKLSSTELVTVLEKMGVSSQPGRPITAQLTNEAGETRQRPTPWTASMKSAAN